MQKSTGKKTEKNTGAAKKTAAKKAASKTRSAKSAKTGTAKTASKKAYDLVIVESPAKAKTISQFLGSGYKVQASGGHVRDLPKSTLGVDIEHDFEPKYIQIRGKKEIISAMKAGASGARRIYLATDPDREGEAISWHIAQMLDVDPIR